MTQGQEGSDGQTISFDNVEVLTETLSVPGKIIEPCVIFDFSLGGVSAILAATLPLQEQSVETVARKFVLLDYEMLSRLLLFTMPQGVSVETQRRQRQVGKTEGSPPPTTISSRAEAGKQFNSSKPSPVP